MEGVDLGESGNVHWKTPIWENDSKHCTVLCSVPAVLVNQTASRKLEIVLREIEIEGATKPLVKSRRPSYFVASSKEGFASKRAAL